jgi:hypothetical protein
VTRALLAILAAAVWASGQTVPGEEAVHKLILDGRYAEAEPLARRVLADAEAAAGTHSKAVSQVLDDLLELGIASTRINDPQYHAMAERALALREELFGRNSTELAGTFAARG